MEGLKRGGLEGVVVIQVRTSGPGVRPLLEPGDQGLDPPYLEVGESSQVQTG